MAQHPSQFDIDCLHLLVADPDARRASLSAAMIKLHAVAIARSHPELRDEALEIVRHLEALHRRLPSRQSLGRTIRERIDISQLGEPTVNRLIDTIWEHVSTGRD